MYMINNYGENTTYIYRKITVVFNKSRVTNKNVKI